MESVSWLVLRLGGLEYWNTGWNICVRFVYSGFFLFGYALIYIPRPFYTYFLLDGTCEANGGRCI